MLMPSSNERIDSLTVTILQRSLSVRVVEQIKRHPAFKSKKPAQLQHLLVFEQAHCLDQLHHVFEGKALLGQLVNLESVFHSGAAPKQDLDRTLYAVLLCNCESKV